MSRLYVDGRGRPGQAKAPLDVGLYLGAQAQHETSARLFGQIPGGVGQGEGAAGETDGDGGAEAQPGGVLCHQGQGQEGIVLRLLGPHGVKAHRLSGAGQGGNLGERGGGESGVEEHGRETGKTI